MAIGMPELSGGNVFGGAAIVGVVVGFWSYIKLYASKIFSLFVVRIEFNRQTGVAFAILLNKKFKCSPLGKKLYTGYHEYVRPNKRNQIVAFEEIPIDPAIGNIVNGEGMSTRPGRIDRAIEFEPLDRDGRIKMATRIMEGLAEDKWKYFIDKYDKDTGAQFQERCCRLALRLFWEDKKNLLTSKDD